MHAIMVMLDSLRRDMLPAYAKECMAELPNFKRLAAHAVTFDKCYVTSMPCMPARRELHTGRANFMHRSWGPLEPYDDSMPELLKQAGIHAHLATDHYHYIQDGGATYCGRYSTWDCYRGQESDAWIPDARPHGDELPPQVFCNARTFDQIKQMRKRTGWQNLANRGARRSDRDYTQVKTVDNGISFLQKNADCPDWFLQIEMFDPHEPFDSPDSYQKKWFDPDRPSCPDWPAYTPAAEEDDTEGIRKKYAALLEFCDHSLGRILDAMDELDLWKDTLLIVNTDHGFCLGEHAWWGKGMMPDYEELSHTPLFVWDPVAGKAGERCGELVQTIDLAPTILAYFGLPVPDDMRGISLIDVLRDGKKNLRQYAVFGYHGGAMNITDGRYVYMRAARRGGELFEYTLMPTHMNQRFRPNELAHAMLCDGFSFTKGCPVLKIPTASYSAYALQSDMLYDLSEDPGQHHPAEDPQTEERMLRAIAEEMKKNDAPAELYAYYGLQ